MWPQVVLEIADHPVDGQALVSLGQLGSRGPQRGLAAVERHITAEPPGGGQGVEHDPGLLRGSRPQLHHGVGPRTLGNHIHFPLEDFPLPPSGVVVGQAGDLVEELAAPVVVEPLGGQLLGLGGEPLGHIISDGPVDPRRVQMDVDDRLDHHASWAKRTPEKCQRVWGWKKLR